MSVLLPGAPVGAGIAGGRGGISLLAQVYQPMLAPASNAAIRDDVCLPAAAPPRRVSLFITCFNDTMFPQTGRAVVTLLERLGVAVDFPLEQTCCGQMHFNTGYAQETIPLVRRFVDPAAQFLFVKPSEVLAVAEQFGATPFDMEGVFWGHRGELCTFDLMIEEFSLNTKPLLRLATIVRGADTARLDLAPEAPGLLAVSLGLSRMFDDDLAQLDAGMLLYDSFYRWSRDATAETHSSLGHRGRRPR